MELVYTISHAIIENEKVVTWVLIYGLMLVMVAVIVKLCIESKAPKIGVFALFLALGLGFTGFIAKDIIAYFMSS